MCIPKGDKMIKIKLTTRQKDAVDWVLGGLVDAWDDDGFREDNDIEKSHDFSFPFIEGNYLHLDNSEQYFMDLMFDLKYRLCDQISDVFTPDAFKPYSIAKSNGIINAAYTVWLKIKKEIDKLN